eukprot:3854044-Rhodomonas_salina.2
MARSCARCRPTPDAPAAQQQEDDATRRVSDADWGIVMMWGAGWHVAWGLWHVSDAAGTR